MRYRMRPEIKRQWVEALRSGKYRQGRGALRRGDEYCCLGVLCDLAIKAGVPVVVISTAEPEIPKVYDGQVAMPPVSVWRWAGVGPGPQVQPAEAYAAAQLNDQGSTFDQVAAFIERSTL